MSNRNLVIGVIVVLVILVGWYFLQSQKPQAPAPAPQVIPQEEEEATKEAEAEDEDMEEEVVTVGSTGFSPKEISIKVGEEVSWMNEDRAVHTVNSAVHPTHQVYPPLNLGNIQTGGKVSLSFPEAGTYKYHDHLNPSFTGSVIVE